MKKLILMLGLALPVAINAQDTTKTKDLVIAINGVQNITILDGERALSKGSKPSYQFTIPQAITKDVEKDWQKYIKAGSKGKVETANGETFIVGAVNKNISPTTFDIYSTMVESKEGVRITAWFVGPDSIYISPASNTDQNLAVQKYLHDFAIPEYKEAVGKELKAEQEKLKALEADVKEFIKEEEKSNKKINESQRSIERQKHAIKMNEQDHKNKAEQIGAQKKVVEQQRTVSADATKASEKVQKSYENELKKLEKEHEKLNKEIDKWEAAIREEGRSIEKSKQNQRLKNDSVEKQKLVVKAIEEKLAAIK